MDESPRQSPTRILLPYAIGNMVFIQATPFGLLLFAACVGLFFGLVRLLTGNQAREIAPLIALLVVIFLVGAAMIGLRFAVWRPAREGRHVAIVMLYVLHVLFLVGAMPFALIMVSFVLGPWIVDAVRAGPVFGIAVLAALAILTIMWIIAATNLFERNLWTFARLDGRCPACRSYRFGRIRRPCTVTCANCGAVLQFERPA